MMPPPSHARVRAREKGAQCFASSRHRMFLYPARFHFPVLVVCAGALSCAAYSAGYLWGSLPGDPSALGAQARNWTRTAITERPPPPANLTLPQNAAAGNVSQPRGAAVVAMAGPGAALSSNATAGVNTTSEFWPLAAARAEPEPHAMENETKAENEKKEAPGHSRRALLAASPPPSAPAVTAFAVDPATAITSALMSSFWVRRQLQGPPTRKAALDFHRITTHLPMAAPPPLSS